MKFSILPVIFLLLVLCCSLVLPDTFQNPVISGFYPDPSICRVADDYYMVHSSFEFFPGFLFFTTKTCSLAGEHGKHGIARVDSTFLDTIVRGGI